MLYLNLGGKRNVDVRMSPDLDLDPERNFLKSPAVKIASGAMCKSDLPAALAVAAAAGFYF